MSIWWAGVSKCGHAWESPKGSTTTAVQDRQFQKSFYLMKSEAFAPWVRSAAKDTGSDSKVVFANFLTATGSPSGKIWGLGQANTTGVRLACFRS